MKNKDERPPLFRVAQGIPEKECEIYVRSRDPQAGRIAFNIAGEKIDVPAQGFASVRAEELALNAALFEPGTTDPAEAEAMANAINEVLKTAKDLERQALLKYAEWVCKEHARRLRAHQYQPY